MSRQLILQLLRQLPAIGVEPKVVVAQLGLAEGDLASGPERLHPSVARRFWVTIGAVTGRSGYGLELAAHIGPEQYDLFGGIVATSRTVGEAVLNGIRSSRLLTTSEALSLHISKDRARLVLSAYRPDHLHPECVEFCLGSIVNLGRLLTGHEPHPSLEVHFSHTETASASAAARFFRSPIAYGAHSDALTFDSALLTAPLRSANVERCRELKVAAREALSVASSPDSFLPSVTAAVRAALEQGDTRIERVAERLGWHPKALTRRLHAQGLTYRELLSQLRYEQAQRYLAHDDTTVGDVAKILGYSGKRAFVRAFQKWAGHSPRAHRVKLSS